MRQLVAISRGNSKLGKLPNFSLTPGRTCAKCARETCLTHGCYAIKAYRRYKESRAAWDRNTEAAVNDLPALREQLTDYFAKDRPAFFRVHVAGDFVSKEYAIVWRDVMAANPGTMFLAFTKQYDICGSIDWPENVSIVFSAWPGVEIPATEHKFPVAWMNDGTDPRIPGDALHCPGDCEHCGMCFSLGKTGHDVVFNKH